MKDYLSVFASLALWIGFFSFIVTRNYSVDTVSFPNVLVFCLATVALVILTAWLWRGVPKDDDSEEEDPDAA